MNRGRRFEEIFNGPKDYKAFTELLKKSSVMWNMRVAAYCLMPNHYHILVQTPDGNISRCMRHLNGVYTQFFNRRNKCDGPLFRGRYKSILVSADDYLLQLVRYIHRNPLKAGLVDDLYQYKWSSHKGYLSVASKWKWLNKQFILCMLTPHRKDLLREYKNFLKDEKDDHIRGMLDGNQWPSCLGPAEFIDWVKGEYYTLKTNDEIPQARALAPDKEQIIEIVCSYYQIKAENLYISRRGRFNEPRNVGIYLFRKLRQSHLKEIGEYFRIKKYSSVSSIIERLKARMNADRKLKSRVNKISDILLKRQGQT
jgi:putative transposase